MVRQMAETMDESTAADPAPQGSMKLPELI